MFAKILLPIALAVGSVTAATIPSDVLAPRAAKCNTGNKADDNGGPHVICYSYCEHTSKRVVGKPVKVGADINCDTSSCSDLHSQVYTATQSFEINIGATIDSNPGEEDILKGGASAGAGWSWATAKATTNTFTFNLKKGDKGHVVFRPYFHQSCGDLKYFGYEVNDDDLIGYCSSTPAAHDKNACGRTPLLINNFADGQFSFCYTAGSEKGKGC